MGRDVVPASSGARRAGRNEQEERPRGGRWMAPSPAARQFRLTSRRSSCHERRIGARWRLLPSGDAPSRDSSTRRRRDRAGSCGTRGRQREPRRGQARSRRVGRRAGIHRAVRGRNGARRREPAYAAFSRGSCGARSGPQQSRRRAPARQIHARRRRAQRATHTAWCRRSTRVAAVMAGYCCIYHVNMINSPQEGLFGLRQA